MEGANTITRTATSPTGLLGTASVTGTLNTKPPIVVINSPTNGQLLRATPVTVSWSVDGVAQTTLLSENLVSGINTITRTATDSAGNVGTASVVVTYNPPPIISSVPSHQSFPGAVYSYLPKAVSNYSNLNWHLLRSISGASLDISSGFLQYIPNKVEQDTFSICVIDTAGGADTQTFIVNVVNPADADCFADDSVIQFSDFSDLSMLKLNGDAAKINPIPNVPVLRLVECVSQQWGSAFLKRKVKLYKDDGNLGSFSTFFSFRISNPGGTGRADGMCLVLQANSDSSHGSSGGAMGYGQGSLSQSIATEFDIYYNEWDPPYDHVGIDIAGNLTSQIYRDASGYFPSGSIAYCWVDYNSVDSLYTVRLAHNSIRPDSAFLSYKCVLPQILQDSSAWIGFTAGTGDAYSDHDILAWTISSEYQPLGGNCHMAWFTSNPSIICEAESLYTYQSHAQDDISSPIHYSLVSAPTGMSIDSISGTILWHPTLANIGRYTVEVMANNGIKPGYQSFPLVIVPPSGSVPVITSQPSTLSHVGDNYSYIIQATNPNQCALQYDIVNAPAGVSISGDTLHWLPTHTDIGTWTLTVRVTDCFALRASQTFSLVVLPPSDGAPRFVSIPVTTLGIGTDYNYLVEAVDQTKSLLQLVIAPSGMVMGPVSYALQDSGTDTARFQASAAIFWSQAAILPGSYSIAISATDADGSCDTQNFVLQVRATNHAPVFVSIPPSLGTQNQLYSYQAQAQDLDGDALTYFLVTGPSGMTVTSSGLVQWTPTITQVGTIRGIISVTDGIISVNQQLTINVAKVNSPPVIVSSPVLVAVQGAEYLYQVNAIDPDHDLITYKLLSAPSGMTISSSGLIDWPENGARPNNAYVALQVSDPYNANASQSWNIRLTADTIAPVVKISLSANPVKPGEIEVITVSATDNVSVASYGLTVGGTPVVLDVNHQYSFTPLSTGMTSLAAFATDPAGNRGTGAAALTVSTTADNIPPNISLSYSPSNPQVGDNVFFTIIATDNVEIDAERLWLKVDGIYIPVVNGSATYQTLKQGTFKVLATVYDMAGNYGEASLNLTVNSNIVDNNPPTASISSPIDTTVFRQVPIFGTASDENFAYYTLSYRLTSSQEYIEYMRSTLPVIDGQLGIIDGTTLENGSYEVLLTVYDQAGNSSADQITVNVDGNAKVGNFSLSFSDMSIPLPGMNLTAIRSYDSRDKTDGDFGIGWHLDLHSMQLTESCIPGTLWNIDFINNDPIYGYSISSGNLHTVTITIPGGRTQVFDAVAHLYNKFDPTYGYFTYEPHSGTYGKLTALDATDFVVDGGQLYDATGDFQSIFNPNKYSLTFIDGTSYTIDQDAGGVTEMKDANGNKIDLTATQISHSSGKNFTIARDPEGRITNISNGTGQSVSYSYDGHGNLQKVIDPNGNMTRFSYGPNSYLMEIFDARGIRATRTEYDDQGRMVRQINPANDTMYFDHDVNNNKETTQDFNGNSTQYTYDEKGNVLTKTNAQGKTWTYQYDANDNLTETIDPIGNRKYSTFDNNGNELTSTNELGYTTTKIYNNFGHVLTETDPLNRTTQYSYDSIGNLLTTTGPDNAVISQKTYDANGNVLTEMNGNGDLTQYSYNSSGQMIQRIDPEGRTTNYVIDDRGNTIAEVNAKGDTTKSIFDNNNNLIGSIDIFGDTTKSTYNVFNKIASQTDARGNTITYEYDLFGQLTKTIAPDTTFTQKGYDAQGNVTSTTDEVGRRTSFVYDFENKLIQTTFNDGSFTKVEYDPLGRRSATVDANGNRTEYEYDAVGNNTIVRDALRHETHYEYDQANRRTAMVDAQGHRTTYFYDYYDRLTKTTFVDNSYKTTEYDNAGRKVAEVDQGGNRTVFAYDSVGNLRSVQDPMGHVTSYTYDANNNRMSQKDANNHSTLMEYDKLNRLILRTYPNGDRELFGYDPNGNQTLKVDGEGDSTVFAYDVRNREIQRRFASSGHTVVTKYTYDGKPDTIIDFRGATIYNYDNRGRQASVTNPDGSYILSQYDFQGNRTIQKTQFDSVSYGYDPLNRMATITGQNNGITRYFYDAVGDRDSVSNANGMSAGYHYDNLNRLINVTNYGTGGAVISSFTYTLNNAGIRTSVAESDGSQVAYGYDASYKLTSEIRTGTHPYSIAYTYDNVGNRLTQTKDGVLTTSAYNNRDQLTGETGPNNTAYVYDHTGRITNKTDNAGSVNYTWIDNDRLAQVSGPSVLVNYSYDHNGQRISETTSGSTKKYLIDYQLPYGQVIAETDGSGNLVAGYVYGLERISQSRGGNVHFYAADGQGSVRQLTNSSGNVTDSWTFDAFGNMIFRSGTTENNFLYVGEGLDPNCGFYNLRARWYNPTNGRFASVDPYEGDPQAAVSLHRYLYANASPVNNSDPSGNIDLGEEMASIDISNTLCAFPVDASNSRSVRSCIQSFTGQVSWWIGDPSTRCALFTLKLNKATNFAMIVQFKKGSIVNLTTGEYQKVNQFGGQENADFPDWTVDSKDETIEYQPTAKIDPLTYEASDQPTTAVGYRRSYQFITAVFDRREIANASPYDASFISKAIIYVPWDANVTHKNDGSCTYP